MNITRQQHRKNQIHSQKNKDAQAARIKAAKKARRKAEKAAT